MESLTVKTKQGRAQRKQDSSCREGREREEGYFKKIRYKIYGKNRDDAEEGC